MSTSSTVDEYERHGEWVVSEESAAWSGAEAVSKKERSSRTLALHQDGMAQIDLLSVALHLRRGTGGPELLRAVDARGASLA